jgi:hypothetical protein
MPPVLGDKCLRREIKIYGIENNCVLGFSNQGVEIKAKGTKLGVTITWPELVKACATPVNVPSKFESRAYEFLIHQAKERTAREAKRLQKQIAKELQERQK